MSASRTFQKATRSHRGIKYFIRFSIGYRLAVGTINYNDCWSVDVYVRAKQPRHYRAGQAIIWQRQFPFTPDGMQRALDTYQEVLADFTVVLMEASL